MLATATREQLVLLERNPDLSCVEVLKDEDEDATSARVARFGGEFDSDHQNRLAPVDVIEE